MQMLLVPVDKDVCHLNASYNASNSSSQHARRNSGREDDIQDDALFAVPALKPSASLLAGDLAGDDEDEEETAVKDEGQFGQNGASTFVQDLEMTTVSRNSEDGVSPVETEARVHRVANQQASDVLQAQSIGGGPSERTFQPTRGTWDITMVLREYSVPGTLYLFARTLVFRSDSDGSEDANEPFLSSETRYHGRTWRWRLERLTQVQCGQSHILQVVNSSTIMSQLTAQRTTASSYMSVLSKTRDLDYNHICAIGKTYRSASISGRCTKGP